MSAAAWHHELGLFPFEQRTQPIFQFRPPLLVGLVRQFAGLVQIIQGQDRIQQAFLVPPSPGIPAFGSTSAAREPAALRNNHTPAADQHQAKCAQADQQAGCTAAGGAELVLLALPDRLILQVAARREVGAGKQLVGHALDILRSAAAMQLVALQLYPARRQHHHRRGDIHRERAHPGQLAIIGHFVGKQHLVLFGPGWTGRQIAKAVRGLDKAVAQCAAVKLQIGRARSGILNVSTGLSGGGRDHHLAQSGWR